ncbi:MAG: hypothetical protein CMQ21_07565 [Gammaproteobacteria bacterium]|nr:hypothetical protein [Gammaproteobacteria bacterium]
MCSSFRDLKKKERKSVPGFVRVEDVTGESINPALLEIRLPNGVSLDMLTQLVSPDQMLQTLAALMFIFRIRGINWCIYTLTSCF